MTTDVAKISSSREAERLRELHRYGVLDTVPEVAFDRIVALAQRLFKVPIVLISLVAEERQWFKACYGLDLRETSRDVSFCAHAIHQDGVMVVLDTRDDPRFRENPYVTGPLGIRFYAGAPLRTPGGHNLGTLCLLDTVPHAELSGEAEKTLADLAAIVVDELELRRANAETLATERTLRASEAHLRLLVGQLPAVLWTTDRELRLTASSGAALASLGRTPGDVVGVTLFEQFKTTDPTFEPIAQHLLALQGTPASYELTTGRRTFNTYIEPFRDERGEIIGCLGVALDITERKEAEQRVALQAEFRRELIALMETSLQRGLDASFYGRLLECAARVIPGAQAGSLLLREEGGRCIYVAAIGYDLERLKHTYLWERELFRAADQPGPQLISEFGENYAMEPERFEMLHSAGPTAAIQVSMSIPIEAEGRTVAYFNLDNFDAKEAFDLEAVEMARVFAQQTAALLKRFELEGAFEHLAHHDPLTGLPNRRLFECRLQQAMAHTQGGEKPLAVALLDLDDFKHFNDSRGHAFGDSVLKGVAERLASSLRDCDTLARWGGDEFVLLLPDLSGAQEAVAIAERLLTTFRNPLMLEGQPVHVGVSLGIDVYANDATHPEDLMRHADIALYGAKTKKNSYQVFTEAMNEKVQVRLALESDFREALEQQALTLHYQPRINLVDGRITSLETLARWHHPVRGWVAPATFIPLAEETGLIERLGDLVLDLACAQAKAWQEAGRGARVAVNVSAEQLRNPGFVDTVQRTLGRHSLDPALLELEITESTAMADVEGGIVKLRQLRELGVYLSIDDFGTAYSSLAYLKQLPVHSLKIDQAFVKGLGRPNATGEASIVQAVVALARSFRLNVVAEGVETEAQRLVLQALGCDEAQGYLFAKPLPAVKVVKLLTEDSGMAASLAAFAV